MKRTTVQVTVSVRPSSKSVVVKTKKTTGSVTKTSTHSHKMR